MGSICERQLTVTEDIPVEPASAQVRASDSKLQDIYLYRQHTWPTCQNPRVGSFQDFDLIQSDRHLKKKTRKKGMPNFKVSHTRFLDPHDEANFLSPDDNHENQEIYSFKDIDLRFRRECLLTVQIYRSQTLSSEKL